MKPCTLCISIILLLGSLLHAELPADFKAREQQILGWETRAERMQPPATVVAATGLQPGMVIGEVGAGWGRMTLHFAKQVGPTGKVYANDIWAECLDFLKQRCQAHGIGNVETVLGTPEDPRFPRKDLDMIVMVWTYHMMEKPLVMLKSLVPYLKPGGTLVMVEPIPSETEAEIQEATKRTGKVPTDIHVCNRENIGRDAREAGLRLEKVREGLLEKDHVYILRRDGSGS